jgi:hypothetical protein
LFAIILFVNLSYIQNGYQHFGTIANSVCFSSQGKLRGKANLESEFTKKGKMSLDKTQATIGRVNAALLTNVFNFDGLSILGLVSML